MESDRARRLARANPLPLPLSTSSEADASDTFDTEEFARGRLLLLLELPLPLPLLLLLLLPSIEGEVDDDSILSRSTAAFAAASAFAVACCCSRCKRAFRRSSRLRRAASLIAARCMGGWMRAWLGIAAFKSTKHKNPWLLRSSCPRLAAPGLNAAPTRASPRCRS